MVRGLIFADPQPRRPSGLRSVRLDIDEVPRMKKLIVGAAVGVEHCNVSIGRVIGVHHNKCNDILVDLYIDTRLEQGRDAKRKVTSGVLRELSFGSLTCLDDKTGIRYTNHYPFEVSLVSEGGVERSSILFWGDLATGFHWSNSGYSKMFQRPQIMETVDSEVKRTRVTEPTVPDARELEQYYKMKPLLDQLSDDPDNVAAILQLANEGIEVRKKTFSDLLSAGGLNDYVTENLSPEDQAQFRREISRLSAAKEGIPVMVRVAASAVSNYRGALAKGEATIAQATQKLASKPQVAGGLPAMATLPASEMRAPKSEADSLMKRLQQNRAALEQMMSPVASTEPLNATDISARLAQTRVEVQHS